jgi:hypothetical protein
VSDLTAQGEEGAAALLVVLTGVLVGAVDVSLVAAQEPLGAGDLDAAVVDAGVAVIGDAEFGLELEVYGRAAAPDEEAVLLEEIVGGDFADEDVVFDAPILRIAVLVFQTAVEDGLEAFVGVGERVWVDLRAGWWGEGEGWTGVWADALSRAVSAMVTRAKERIGGSGIVGDLLLFWCITEGVIWGVSGACAGLRCGGRNSNWRYGVD